MSGPNLSLRQKSASRLALVQCLYRAHVGGIPFSPEASLKDVKERVKEGQGGDTELFEGVEPDYSFLKKLLGGIAPEITPLTALLKEHLATDWKIERMSPLLIAILQAGLYEIKHHANLKAPILVDEYTRLARSFFEEDEVNFVHGILHKLAGLVRP